MAEVLPSTPVEFLKGVGPKRSDALVSELGIRTCMDLLLHLPFRYEDRSQFHRIADIQGEHTAVQMQGVITQAKEVRGARGSRLIAVFDDGEATMELQWFRGAQWILRNLPVQKQVVIYGKPNLYKGKWNIAHPEVELLSHFETRKGDGLHPVYSSTEKLGRQGLHSQGLAKLIRNVAAAVQPAMTETLPERVLKEMKLMGRAEALRIVHAPSSPQEAERAQTRLRFEELFLLQLTLLQHKKTVTEDMPGVRFAEVGDAFNTFYHDRLPFELTDAQKRVLREIRGDLNTGWHMNRLAARRRWEWQDGRGLVDGAARQRQRLPSGDHGPDGNPRPAAPRGVAGDARSHGRARGTPHGVGQRRRPQDHPGRFEGRRH